MRVGTGEWIELPSDDQSPAARPVRRAATRVRRPTAAGSASGDDLYCVGEDGIDETVEIAGLDIDGGDVLAIAGDAAALVRRGPTEVVQFDWRTQEIPRPRPVTVRAKPHNSTSPPPPTSSGSTTARETSCGPCTRGGIEAIDKDASDLLVLGDEGDVISDGEGRSR